ncbi:septal ring lytic transglycosylase RlpA family protein [Photobacterium aquimaris]|uniref:Endolytic peptidoglycan transglycosylase RlpA n=2 Tax=Vibrionaceae TaxID=641 RepID=A0A2T3IR79_9GAMM|nr:septal ring lytic transglycosylase RlpA family protein [Photobacterium aquimaris]PSW00108.1 septal ring lytic transglycosylase RlpA family protein [Photobacterium aquimaris]
MMMSGCTNSEQLNKAPTVETKRPVLIIKPVEHKKANKVIYGKASFYANMFQGRKTANGQIFDQGKLTAAHRTLPFGTRVKVTNISNNKSVIVTVNDRGPFIRGRMIDLSSSAFKAIGNTRSGVLNVKMEILK